MGKAENPKKVGNEGRCGCAPRQRALRARPSPGAPTLRRAENALLPSEPKSPLPRAGRKTKGHRGSVNYPETLGECCLNQGKDECSHKQWL